MKFPVNVPSMKFQRAFTLIEMMITVAIVAILAAIALPSYDSYIVKSEIRTAQSDILALSLNIENVYQRTLSYPTTITTNTTIGLETQFKGWHHSGSNFDFSLTEHTATDYTIQASGTGRQSGCNITITNENERESTGCKYITAGKWL